MVQRYSVLNSDEIVAVKTKIKDAKGEEKEVVCSEDDGIRKGMSMETLSKLKTVFKKDGTTTAGTSSQISDGAAAVVLARRSTAQKLGLPILAKFVHYATKGCPPEIMGIGPAVAIPELLAKTGKKVEDIDIWEINEAFASQATYCVERLGIDRSKLNPKGGAIALGHPLGCTGARQIATLIPELYRTNSKLGVVSMCIGTGMGAAGLIERE
jgi:acetyl-CoA acyltransferase 1